MPDGSDRSPSLAGADARALPDAAVAVRGLTKTYKASGKTPAKHALIDVDLEIPRGALFGLLGPNGAGKSTLINILAGLVNKTGGSAHIWGTDIDANPRQARAAIGVVPQELNIDPFFTPRELLELQAGLYGVPPGERRSDEILAAMGLADKATGLCPDPFRRHAPAPDGGQGHGARPARAGTGRADRRRRYRAAAAALGPCAGAECPGHDDPADHPLPGGSRGALRPHRDHQPWPG